MTGRLIVSALIFLCGCTAQTRREPQWTHPGKSAEEFSSDRSDCIKQTMKEVMDD